MKFSSTDVDPQGDLWSDPAFVDEYLAALCDEADGRFAGQARASVNRTTASSTRYATRPRTARRWLSWRMPRCGHGP